MKFLNTDFELLSKKDLIPVVNLFGEDAVVLFNGSWGKYFKASFESPYDSSGDPNDVIAYFYKLITSLNEEEKELYDSCFSKLFAVGFESGEKQAVYYSELRENTINMLSKLKARLGTTLYSFSPEPDEKE